MRAKVTTQTSAKKDVFGRSCYSLYTVVGQSITVSAGANLSTTSFIKWMKSVIRFAKRKIILLKKIILFVRGFCMAYSTIVLLRNRLIDVAYKKRLHK